MIVLRAESSPSLAENSFSLLGFRSRWQRLSVGMRGLVVRRKLGDRARASRNLLSAPTGRSRWNNLQVVAARTGLISMVRGFAARLDHRLVRQLRGDTSQKSGDPWSASVCARRSTSARRQHAGSNRGGSPVHLLRDLRSKVELLVTPDPRWWRQPSSAPTTRV